MLWPIGITFFTSKSFLSNMYFFSCDIRDIQCETVSFPSGSKFFFEIFWLIVSCFYLFRSTSFGSFPLDLYKYTAMSDSESQNVYKQAFNQIN